MTEPIPSIHLEPVTWDNIDDMLEHSVESSTDFYELPLTEEAERFMSMVSNQFRNQFGYWFNAYDPTDSRTCVGGGQLYFPDRGPIAELGYWVAIDHRRKRYGTAVLSALEHEAIEVLPCLERIELEIDKSNLASLALAESMGYEILYHQKHNKRDIFWKVPS